MIDRFLFVQSLDTLRCYEENVLESIIDANIGSIFGIGFAPWTGGAIQFLNQYGLDQAVQRANELEAKYGERFKAPQRLVESVAIGSDSLKLSTLKKGSAHPFLCSQHTTKLTC